MKVTAIKQQVKRTGRYSIFIDDKYSFSLSADALLDSHIVIGLELSQNQIGDYKRLSDDDKMYANVLNYLAIRPRSEWEIATYLKRKQASPTLAESILSKLSVKQLIDDRKFAEAFVRDHRLLKPTSRRKLTLELRQKHVKDSVIQAVVGNESDDEQTALKEIIIRKRRQTRYQDDLKLMQYLARQGFNYSDIKSALDDNVELDD